MRRALPRAQYAAVFYDVDTLTICEWARTAEAAWHKALACEAMGGEKHEVWKINAEPRKKGSR